jgi:hypothetical protein
MQHAAVIDVIILAYIMFIQPHLQLRKDAPLADMISCHRGILQINPVLAEEVVVCTGTPQLT